MNYRKVTMGSGLLLASGIVLFIISLLIDVPGDVKTFIGIPYATNPQYALVLTIKTSLMLTGLVFTAISLVYIFLDIMSGRQREVVSSSPESSAPNRTICVFCGAENPAETSYCLKCAKRIKIRDRSR
jgi:ribosomal protein L40E